MGMEITRKLVEPKNFILQIFILFFIIFLEEFTIEQKNVFTKIVSI